MVLLFSLSIALFACVALVARQHRCPARPIVILGTGPLTSKLIDEVDCSDDG